MNDYRKSIEQKIAAGPTSPSVMTRQRTRANDRYLRPVKPNGQLSEKYPVVVVKTEGKADQRITSRHDRRKYAAMLAGQEWRLNVTTRAVERQLRRQGVLTTEPSSKAQARMENARAMGRALGLPFHNDPR